MNRLSRRGVRVGSQESEFHETGNQRRGGRFDYLGFPLWVLYSSPEQLKMADVVEKHFLIDVMLGKLAKWLRILGFDVRVEQFRNQSQIDGYRKEGLLLITRNRKWAGQTGVFCISANDPSEQLQEVVRLVPIEPHEIRLLERCILCNDILRTIDREDVFGHVPDYVFETHTSFHQCPTCRKVYWAGTHPKRVMQQLQCQLGWSVLEESDE